MKRIFRRRFFSIHNRKSIIVSGLAFGKMGAENVPDTFFAPRRTGDSPVGLGGNG